MKSDTQTGKVLVNYQVTSAVMVGACLVAGYLLEWDLVGSAFLGLITAAAWLALELHSWEPGYATDSDGDSE